MVACTICSGRSRGLGLVRASVRDGGWLGREVLPLPVLDHLVVDIRKGVADLNVGGLQLARTGLLHALGVLADRLRLVMLFAALVGRVRVLRAHLVEQVVLIVHIIFV